MASFNIPEDELIDKNIYIVNSIGWEYNDEYYYRPESEGGRPVNSFTLKSLADEFCKVKNCEWFIKGLKEYDNPGHYIQSWDVSQGQIEELLKGVPGGLRWDEYEFVCDDPSALKFEHVWPIIEGLGIHQYEVIAVRLTA